MFYVIDIKNFKLWFLFGQRVKTTPSGYKDIGIRKAEFVAKLNYFVCVIFLKSKFMLFTTIDVF